MWYRGGGDRCDSYDGQGDSGGDGDHSLIY